MFSLKKLAAIASAALLISAVSASAAVVIDKTTPLGALVPVANLSPTSTGGAGPYFDNVTGNQFSGPTMVARDVWEGTVNAGIGVYSSVSAGSSATFALGGSFSALDIAWGSPDTYNDIDFYLGGFIVDTINGGAIQPPIAISAALVRIGVISGGLFDTIVIRSGQNAFEFANLAAVPLPAAAWLLLAGLGGLGLVGRRRKA